MSVITFLSDYGAIDHYQAAVRAKILGAYPQLRIIDISHEIPPCDITQASYLLQSVFRDFPEGTIHLIAVNDTGLTDSRHLLVVLEGHYFLAADNGIFGLISDHEPSLVLDINPDKMETSFPGKEILAPVAAQLASGIEATKLGKPAETFKKMLSRQVKANKKGISGHVQRVDHYGNLITNIDRALFKTLNGDRTYTISFGRETTRRIHNNYYSVDAGDCFVIFNDLDLLEIGIVQGNAAELLGLEFDSPVTVTFED